MIQAQTPEIITVKPVFAVLNKKTISLFENEHLSGLYTSLGLSQVMDIFQPPQFNATGVFCFYVIRGPKKSALQKDGKKPKGEVKMKLCFRDAAAMESWKRAILSYDVCTLKPSPEDEEDETNTVDGSAKVAMIDREKREQDKINGLLEQDEKAEQAELEEKEQQRQALKDMKGKLDKIKEKMEKQRIQDAKDRHRAIEERKRLIDLQHFLHTEEDCLTKKEREKTTLDIENSLKKISQSSDEDSESLIAGIGDELNSESNKERLLKEHARIEQLECEREQAEKLRNIMIQTTVAYEHIMDTADCYSQDLAHAKTPTIQKTCVGMFTASKPPDLKKLKDCLVEKDFCNVCCDFHIGEAHETNRFSCKQKCTKAMNGEGPSVIVPVNRRIKNLETVYFFL